MFVLRIPKVGDEMYPLSVNVHTVRTTESPRDSEMKIPTRLPREIISLQSYPLPHRAHPP